MATGQARQGSIIFLYSCFYLVTHNRRASKSGKTNLKLLLFFGNFFQIFKESMIEYSFEVFIFRILAKNFANFGKTQKKTLVQT